MLGFLRMPQIIDVCPVSELAPGEKRLVEWEDLEIGVFNCAGTVYAIEDRCTHDDGPLVEGVFDPQACTIECPRHGSLFDLTNGKPKTCPPTFRSTPLRCSSRTTRSSWRWSNGHSRHHHQRGRAEQRGAAGINADYTERYGFHDAENYLYKAPKGLTAELVGQDLGVQVRAPVDARLPHQGAGVLPGPPDAHLGLADAGRGRLRRHPLLRARLRARRALLGRRARRRQEDVRPPGHSRGRAQVPLRRRRPVRVRGRLPPGHARTREAGRDLPGHGLRAARSRGAGPRVLRDDHPAQRQQARGAELRGVVGRLVRLRAAGRARRDAAAGLLPHQHRVRWASSSAR